ncbi:FAD linked oxidase domain protein [Rhizobium sp. CF080]|nr:FAD linked oxidase domain protein [Rhizobium sp. CF080]
MIFQHLGDGNLHYCVKPRHRAPVADAIFSGVAALGGGISAEHGIGVEKAKYLRLVRSEAEMAAMRRLKAAFDPNHILNRNRVFELPV